MIRKNNPLGKVGLGKKTGMLNYRIQTCQTILKDCADNVHFAYLAEPNLKILFEIKKFTISEKSHSTEVRTTLRWNCCKFAVGESVLAAGKLPGDVSEEGMLDPHRYTSVDRLLRQHVRGD